MRTIKIGVRVITCLAVLAAVIEAKAQNSPMTYQGRLNASGQPYSGAADFQVTLFDSEQAGQALGPTLDMLNVSVVDGLFTIELAIPNVLIQDGGNRWIEIAVRAPTGSGAYTTLRAGRRITHAPYAAHTRGLAVDDNGRLGIGTSNPIASLNVLGANDINGTAWFESPKGTHKSHIHYGDTGDWYLRSADSAGKVILQDSGGKVGIGTSAPAAKLHVAGTAGVDGIMFPDGTFQSTAAVTAAMGWSLNGNAATESATHFLGTIDDRPIIIRANNRRAMQFSYATNGVVESINVLGGSEHNSIGAGVMGATIAGGGTAESPNAVMGFFGTVGGGYANSAGYHATVAGGFLNTAPGDSATVSGGFSNDATGQASTASGGCGNTASGNAAVAAGGFVNSATHSFATVSGGDHNHATGQQSTIPKRLKSAAGVCSYAAGRCAKANHDGTFVWGDNVDADFASTGPNEFLVRAGGGVGINTNDPAGFALKVAGPVSCTSLTQTSDSRFKTNVADIAHALDSILELRGVTFDWNSDACEMGGFPGGQQIGFIAQEVEQVLPELVTTDSNGFKSVAYANVVPVLVEAVKSQQRQIACQRAQIDELKSLILQVKSHK